MKDLVLEPPIIIATLVIIPIYLIVIFNLTKNQKIASIFEIIIVQVFFFIISGANFFPLDRLDPGDIGHHDKGFFSGLLLLIIYGGFFILLRGKSKQILSNFVLLFRQPLLGIYLSLIAGSVFWSDNPPVTLKATFGLLFFSIFAVHFARKYNWQELSRILRWNCSFIAIYSIFTAWFVPSVGICRKGWCGGFGHPIDLGNIMAFGFAVWLLNALAHPRYRWRSLFMSTMCLVVMQFTNSAGAFLLFLTLVVIILTTTFLKKLNFTQAFLFVIAILSSFGFISIWLINNLANILSFLNKDISLTGRVPLWTMLIQTKIKEHLWLGYGYNAFWQRWRGNDSPAADVVNVIIGDGRDWVAHAHNGFLDIILNIGLIGLLVFLILFLFNLIQTIRLTLSSQRLESFLPLLILTSIFMTNLSNSPIVIPSLIWFLFVTTTIRLNLVAIPRNNRIYKPTSAALVETTKSSQ